jgi:hypothetical protein
MLNKLTERLIKEENKSLDRDILVEGTLVPTIFSTIERYAMVNNKCCEYNDIVALAKKLHAVNLNDSMTEEEKKSALMDAVKNTDNINVLNESSLFNLNKEQLCILMKKEDYIKIKNEINEYKKCKDEEKQKDFIVKFKNIINRLEPEMRMADDKKPVDAFTMATINSLYKTFIPTPFKNNDDENLKTNILAKIENLAKYIK